MATQSLLPTKASAKALKIHPPASQDAANWAIILVSLLLLAGSVAMLVRAIHEPAVPAAAPIVVQAAPTVAPLPALHLNTSHERIGQEISTPDPIGKSDPFAKP